MKTTKVKCTNCGTEYDACLDNDYITLKCPQCQNESYDIIDPDYQGHWGKDSECGRIWMEHQRGKRETEKRIKKTVVVNRHYKSYTKYIGRGTKFGNDYRIGPDGTREDVIAKHKKDFYANPELQEAVWNELRGEIIGCSCKPLACHGDTYVEYIENRERTENEAKKT